MAKKSLRMRLHLSSPRELEGSPLLQGTFLSFAF
jgi:hypothetical protein